ncbi:protein of unknown function [Candidatus Promineifilum breve]|uniref:Phosphate/phosphite/phosphonate ABC transporter substrate-binding protein n=1 Tax=Candidatus Promineifilum breve TaxID=1806508 RepID=A0A160T434_9CHLR|nr:PhnD/SsuA/transferrin family substrate-binding protein [Candidatus Promineifilum breve]CUS04584.2 protein of unknown function [Candidatus Promineifilum breve]
MNRTYRFIVALWVIPAGLLAGGCRALDSGATADGRPPATAAIPTATVEPTPPPPTLPTPQPTRTVAVPPPAIATATVAPTVGPTATLPPLGAAERPIQLLFPPVAAGTIILQRAAPLVEALRAATGVEFAAGIADSEAALVELICAAPEDTIGFISAAAYTVAHEQCDARAGLVAARGDGLTWQMGMLVTQPGGPVALADLAGQSWAVADTHSLPVTLYFQAQLAAAGIEPGEIVAMPEETSALLALRGGEVDFTTATFVPPIMPLDQPWLPGETDPEVWRLLGVSPTRSPIGYVLVAGEPAAGGYRLRDARARLFDTTPDIFDVTRILAVSAPIPNETVVIGADLPPELAGDILAAMTQFAASGACDASLCSADLFGWTGLQPAEDSAYDPIRAIKDTLELETADLWAELD